MRDVVHDVRVVVSSGNWGGRRKFDRGVGLGKERDDSFETASFEMRSGSRGAAEGTEREAADQANPMKADEENITEGRICVEMFYQRENFGDALFDIEMPHGAAAVESGTIDDGAGEVAIKTHFGQNGAYGRALNGVALFVGEVGRDKAVDEAGEPDVPEGGVGFGAGEKGVADGVCPSETFGVKTVELFGLNAGGSFHMT